MLNLTCDRCGVSINLIHRLTPKSEEVHGDDPRRYWELSWEQSEIWSDRIFDSDPQEWDKWNWNNHVGTYDEWGISAHLCTKCKAEYKQYIKDYQAATVDLNDLAAKDFLDGSTKLRMKTILTELEDHRRRYKEAFLTHNPPHPPVDDQV